MGATRISRRRMLVASGAAVGAPALLAACGQASEEDERTEEEDPALLNAVLEQHLAVAAATAAAEDGPLPDVTSELAKQRKQSIAQLESFVTERDGKAVTEPADAAEAESATEALAIQLEEAIAASLETVGQLSSPAYRQAVHRFITEDAAALAALRSELGGDVAPDAFVFGAPAAEEEESE